MIIITSSKYLYMANKLHQFATFIAFAKEHGVKIYNPSFTPYAENFACSDGNFLCAYPPGKKKLISIKKQQLLYKILYKFALIIDRLKVNTRFLKVCDIGWEAHCHLQSPEFIEMARKTRFLFVQGWHFQNVELVAKHAGEIRKFLAPQIKYSTKVNTFCGALKADGALLIGVHIRHGDFKTFMGGRFFYEVEEYKKFMHQIVNLFLGRKLRFMICSNASFKENEFESFDFTLGPGDAIEDLFSLASCDFLIGPPSSFSMWASFYGATPLSLLEKKDKNITTNHFKNY